jgi:hypothetical protein
LKELTCETLSAVFPTHIGSLGFSLKTFGTALYRENTYVVGWANHIGPNWCYGIALRYNHLQIEKYGSATAFSLDGGILFHLNENLVLAAAMTNLSGNTIGRCRDSLPVIVRGGLCCKLTSGFRLAAEFNKDTRYPLGVRGGCEIQPITAFYLRIGFEREPAGFSSGFGLVLGNVIFDYGFSYHPFLGASHFGSLSFHFGKQFNTGSASH